MQRQILLGYLAIFGLLPFLGANAPAQLKPEQGGEMYVTMKARLFEVDEDTHNKVAKAKWLSKADLEDLEDKAPAENPLFALLDKQKPFLTGKEVNIDSGKEQTLLTATKALKFLPTPDHLRQGNKAPQTFTEGLSLSAQVHISADRRYVRVVLGEKSLEVEGTEKVKLLVDDKGNEGVGEVVSVKEATLTQTRYIPDGGRLLLALSYRPAAVQKKDRWLVVEITPRIFIAAEERERGGQPPE